MLGSVGKRGKLRLDRIGKELGDKAAGSGDREEHKRTQHRFASTPSARRLLDLGARCSALTCDMV